MQKRRAVTAVMMASVLVGLTLLSACGATATPTATQVKVAAPTTAATSAAATATKAPATATVVAATPTAKGPTVGGNLIFAMNAEPDSLNPMNAVNAVSDLALAYVSGALVTMDPKGQYVGYMASSWKSSADGLTWDFSLKKGIKFHDGTPVTAKDFAWTYNFMLDPNNKMATLSTNLSQVKSVSAPDDYTVEIVLNSPYFAFLLSLMDTGRMGPVPQAAYLKDPNAYSRAPIGAGPMKFKEWKTGESVTIERNPDYNWGPDYAHKGPWYIQTITYRFLPDTATTTAAVEAGEVDTVYPSIAAQDVARVKATNKFQVFEGLNQGNVPSLWMNVTKPPFDNVLVRQAFEYVVDRANLVKAVVLGNGTVQLGPMSSSMIGYEKSQESSYGFDPAKAKALMIQAGYTQGSDGTWQKDGQQLKLVFKVSAISDRPKAAEVVQAQFKTFGIPLEIQQGEHSTVVTDLRQGNYVFALLGIYYPEADSNYILFYSKNIGALNLGQVNDPDLDKLLDLTHTETDPVKHQAAVTAACKMIMDKAYMIPLYAGTVFVPLNNKVKGAVFSATANNTIFLDDAWIESK